MVELVSSSKLWSSSRTTLAAMALGCGALVIVGAASATDAFAQDAPAQSPNSSQASSQTWSADSQIQGAVQHQLTSAPGVSGQKITASTNNGVVTLTGSVTDEVTRQLAENAVSSVAGVKSVQNNLTVGNLPPAEAADQQPPPASATPAQTQPAPPADSGAAQPATTPNDGWGPAGPPPDAVNGQVPAQPAAGSQAASPSSGTTYGPPMAQGYPQQNGYPNNGYPQNGQYQARPAYRSSVPRPYVQPSGPVTIPAGTLLTVRLQNYIDGRHLRAGDVFVVNAARDVFENGVLAIPLGATLEGTVVGVKKPGAFSGGGDIQVNLTQLYLNGQAYPVATDVFSTETPGKGSYSAANTIGGTVFGALLGGAIGGGPGAAIGAVAGGASGAAISTATPGPRSFIPAETMITFHLTSPAVVQPVSLDEATRLAASMPRPVLRPRPVYYGPPPGYYGYPYYR